MAAILKLRRGTSFTSLQESELFYNTSLETILIGDGSGSNTSSKILVKLNESNSGSLHLLSDITGSGILASGDITASNLSLTGDADIVGNITLGGDIFLGDGTNATDNINVNASFSGSLIPTTTSVFTLGTSTKKYLDLRVVNATIDNINLPGSGILSSSVTDFTDYSQSVDNRLDLEEAKSLTLQTVTSSLDNRLDIQEAKSVTLETVSSSLDNRLDVEEAKSVTLETVTSSLDNRVSQLETDTGSQDGRLDNLELISASHDGRLDVEEAKSVTLETVTSSLDNRLDIEEAKSVTLETVSSSLDTRLDNVESYTSSFATDTVTLTNKTINGSNNTLTVDISRDTNLAVSDTTEVNMILTDDTISAELIGGVVSGSSQIDYSALSGIDANIISASSDTSQVDMIINGGSISANLKGGVVSGSTQIDYSGLSGINNDIVSASTDSGRVNFTITDGNITADLIGGVVTGSTQINIDHLDTSDLSEHSSNLYYTDVRVKTKLDTETVISGSSQVSLGGDVTGTADDVNVGSVQGVALTSGEATQISNIGSTTISSTQWGYLGASNQGIATTNDVIFNDGDFTGDVQVNGSLTVLGSATEISTTELRIEDKLITVASGSADSAAADGAGIEIDGANKSIQWDHNTTSFVLNAKVSSSVGFKGEGGELTGIDTDQVTEGSNLYYTDTRVKTKLDAETVISGSSQVNADTITNFDANVKTKLDDETVVSGSSQIVLDNADKTGFNTADVSEHSSNLYYTDARVKTKLDAETVVSGSTQIDYSGLSGINNDIVSASTDTAQVDMIINDGSISANLKGGVVSGSSQVNADTITNFDSNVKAKLDVETVVSGSSQIDIHSTDGYVANEHIDHSSITLGSGKGLSGGGTIDTNRSLSLDTGSVHFQEGVELVLPTGTVSGSSQVNADTITNFDSNVKAKLDETTVVSGSTFSSPSQGTVRATINGVNTDVDTGLQQADSPTFNTLTLSSVVAGGSSDFDALFDVSGLLKKRTIGTAAFLNVSASIADDPNSIPTTKAVNDALVAAGAGDITAVNSTTTISPSTTGLIHTEEGTSDSGAYGNTGNIVIAIATGSSHFVNAVQGISPSLPSGVVSGSSQLYSDLDSRYNNELGEGVVSGSAQIDYDSIQNQPTTITSGQASAITANTAKNTNVTTNLSITGTTGARTIASSDGTDAIIPLATTSVSGLLSPGLFDEIDANTAKTGISSGQASAITANTAKTGITSGQASAITTNTDKVGYTTDLVKTKLDADLVVSGSLSDVKTYLSLSSSDISDVAAFSQSGNYASLRAQATTATDVGLGNVTNESKGTMFTSPTFTGTTVAPTATSNDSSTKIATTAYVQGELTDLIGGAGAAFDTLLEISASIANGDSDVVALTQTVGTKLAKSTNLSDLADAGTARTNLGVAIGSDVQAYDSDNATLDEIQTFSGAKTFSSALTVSNNTASTTKTTGAIIVTGGVGISGAINVGGDVVAFSSSDRELKNNILPITNSLDKINSIGGYSFDWNEDKQDIYKGNDIGVIAQEIEQVLPELVQTRENGYKAVKYDKLVSLLIEGIKELSNEVEELKRKIQS